MKKRWLFLLVAGVLCLTGCQTKEEKQKAAIMEAFEDMGVAQDEVIAAVLSKEWQVTDGEETYEFAKDGTGERSGEAFTYSCGFDDENRIMLQITMNDGQVFYYFVTSDETGLGICMEDAEEEEKIHLIPENVSLLDVEKEVPEILGEWADKSDNRYIFKEDMTMVIESAESEKEGSYSVSVRDEIPLLTLVFGGGSNTLEFEYEFADEDTLRLCAPGTDTVHTWIRK